MTSPESFPSQLTEENHEKVEVEYDQNQNTFKWIDILRYWKGTKELYVGLWLIEGSNRNPYRNPGIVPD